VGGVFFLSLLKKEGGRRPRQLKCVRLIKIKKQCTKRRRRKKISRERNTQAYYLRKTQMNGVL
jgi:hypothetical protein